MTNQNRMIVGGSLAVAVLCIVAIVLTVGSGSGTVIAVDAGKDKLIGDAVWRLKQAARAPGSMETRNEHVGIGTIGGEPVVCGEVNGQNGFGGMSGYRRFVVIGSVPVTDPEIGDHAGFNGMWRQAGC